MLGEEKTRETLQRLGFEKLICPLVLPKRKGDLDELYYGSSVSLGNGDELYVRSLDGAFNLLPRRAIKDGLRKVFSIGPGVAGNREVNFLAQVQWHDAPKDGVEHIRFIFRDGLVYSSNELLGRPNFIFAFLCGGHDER